MLTKRFLRQENVLSNPVSDNFRACVLKILLASLPREKDDFLQSPLLNLFPKHLEKLEHNNQSLARHICYGVFREYYFLLAYSNNLLNKPFRHKDIDIHTIVLAGLYELLFLKTPQHAVISEWVELCQVQKKPWAKNVVNVVLRKAQRASDSVEQLKKSLSKNSNNSQIESQHPHWLYQQLCHDWPDAYQTIIEANNHESPMTIRVNKHFYSAETYLSFLLQQEIDARLSQTTQPCIYLSEPCDVTHLPGFSEGWFSVQDEAAQQAAHVLQLEAGFSVLDACAAPGGKACHMLELCPDIDLLCLDASETRLEKVAHNLQRLNLHASLKQANAEDLHSWWNGKLFDRILLDAPCSASGIIRRHPDIKLLRKEDDLARLAHQQTSLLNALWNCLKPNGYLLYATCSVFKIENEQVIAQFISEHSKQAEEIQLALPLGEARSFGWQLFPKINGHDGFYYALLKKRA